MKNNDIETLRKKIRIALIDSPLDQKTLAQKIGVHPSTFYNAMTCRGRENEIGILTRALESLNGLNDRDCPNV